MSGKRILLINSYVTASGITNDAMVSGLREEPYPSSGLLYLASVLRENDYGVFYLDMPALLKRHGVSFEDDIDGFVEQLVTDVYSTFKPDLAGINCLFSGRFPGTIRLGSLLKKIDSALPVVVGGIHPTVFPKRILDRFDCVDFVVIGEGEETFKQLLDSLFFHAISLSDIDGICYRDGGSVKLNPKTRFIADLDSLPFPAWDLLNLQDYEIEEEKWRKHWHNPRGYKLKYRWPLLTSRSCPLACTFCAMHLLHGKKIRFRSAENCVREMEWLYNEYGINYFSIIDDNCTMDKRRLMAMSAEVAKKNLKIYIDTPNGVSIRYFDRDVLDALKAMGLLRLFLAVESGSDFMRNEVMGKHLDREKIFEAFDLLRNEKDIFVRAFFLVGMPQETSSSLEDTYDMIVKLPLDDISIHFATPLPGTKLHDEVMRDGLWVTEEPDVLWAENFHQASDIPWIKPPNLSVDELIEFRKKAKGVIADRYEKLNVDRKYPIHHLL